MHVTGEHQLTSLRLLSFCIFFVNGFTDVRLISCHHYTVSKVDDSSNDDWKFYIRKYDNQIFAIFYV